MKKHILKLVGTALLIMAVVLTQIPPTGINAVSQANNGFMMDGDKLVKYTGTATSVSVPEGVKTIGAEAFADNTALSYITFPKSLESIENGAFSGCRYLNRIILPEGMRTIGNGAFADCDNLYSVTIPASVTQIGTSVFAGCEDLQTIHIDKKNPNFLCEDGVLYNDDKTIIYQVLAGREKKTYTMPNSVEEIKKYAFWGCENLEEVGISGHVDRIGDYAFSNAAGLKSISLSYSVHSIGTKAFEDCRNLVDVTIPPSVSTIDPTAFDGCYRLNIIAEEGTPASDFFKDFEANNASRAEYEDSVSSNTNPHWVKDTAEPEKERESKVNVSDVDNYVEWDVDSPGVLGRSKVVSRQAVIFMDSSAGTVYNGETEGSRNAESQEADKAVQESGEGALSGDAIAYKAFYQDKSLLNFAFPSGVKLIRELAFARSGLTSVQIPYGVEKIENGAFYHCDDLGTVSIPSSVTEIEGDAFTYTKWLNNWYRGSDVNDFLVVGDGILLAYKGNSSLVTIPANVKRIAPGVFKDHSEISQVTIPDSVKVIGEEAFSGCGSLWNISGGGSISQIRDRAFWGCPIETVRIPASVERVGLMAFGGTGVTDSVVFLGSKLPEISYEKSAMRLSNDDYRGESFGDISVAVVNADIRQSDLEGTVLDWKQPGFSGQIYVLDGNVNDSKAEVLASTVPEASASIPSGIFVYGKKYTTVTTEKTEYAPAPAGVSDNSIQGLMVIDHDELKREAAVEVAANGSTVKLDGYHFYVSNAGLGESELKKCIEEHYGTVSEENYFAMDLSLYDPTDTIPITRLGKNPLTVTMPVPAELLDDEICVISLDENGNPEVTFCTYSVRDGREYISFDIEHFSPYALFGAQGELKDKIAQKKALSSHASGLDITPDTGDTLDIRMILIVGLAAFGGFLLLAGLWKPKKY